MRGLTHIDKIDRKLLAALAADSGLTSQVLAEKTGLSPSQCYRRKARLEQSGAILRYHAEIDPSALGLAVGALVHISIDSHTTDELQRFRRFINSNASIQSCYAVTGESDYVAHVQTSDLNALNDFVLSILEHGKSRYHVQSQVILQTIKR